MSFNSTVTHHEGHYSVPRWSPDGDAVAVVSEELDRTSSIAAVTWVDGDSFFIQNDGQQRGLPLHGLQALRQPDLDH